MDVSPSRTTRSTGRDSRDAATPSPASPLRRRRPAADRLLLASMVMVPCLGPRPGSIRSAIAAGRPAVRRGAAGTIASTSAGAVGGARIEAVRRARAIGIARSPTPVQSVAPSSSPDGSPVATPGHRHRSLLSRRPPTRSTARRRPHRQVRPRARRATASPCVAAADIDGNGKFDDHVTIESPPGTILRNVHAVPIPTDPAPPAGIFFPAGLFDYEVVVAKPGDPATVTFHLPDGTVRQRRRHRVLGPPERALVGPDSPCRRRSRHGPGHGEACRRRGRRRGPQRRRRHRGSGRSRGAQGRLEPRDHPPGYGRPHGDLQLLPRGMHRDDRDHGMHAPGPAPVGGLGRRGWPHPSRDGDHAGDVERRADRSRGPTSTSTATTA